MEDTEKTLVCLIDGASWRILNPLIRKKRLPLFSEICENGATGYLNNLGESASPIIWTTIATGWPKEEHGVTDFTNLALRHPTKEVIQPFPTSNLPGLIEKGIKKVEDLIPLLERVSPNTLMKNKKTIWEILSNVGFRIGVVNWWCTYPTPRINGYIVSDHANHIRMKLRKDVDTISLDEDDINNLSNMVYPKSLTGELSRIEEELSYQNLKDILSNITNLNEKSVEKCLKREKFRRKDPLSVLKFSILQDLFALESLKLLDKKYDSDVSFVGLGGLDAICHHFWKYKFPEEFENVSERGKKIFGNLIDNYYVFLEEKIKKIVKVRNMKNTLVISDHGFESAGEDEPEGISGTHTTPPPGVFLGIGPHIRNIGGIEMKSLDLVPTLLYFLGLPVGKDMPGSANRSIFTTKYRKSNPIKKIDSWESKSDRPKKTVKKSEAEEKMKDRLKALGYIE